MLKQPLIHVHGKTGKRLAEATLKQYTGKHGEYPRKVSYTFWAGEFITTEEATLAQVFWMLGVEPVRDGQGRIVDLRLVPSEELGRPRINVVVQVSGQLRDIAGSRLKLLTDAVRPASEAKDGHIPTMWHREQCYRKSYWWKKGLLQNVHGKCL